MSSNTRNLRLQYVTVLVCAGVLYSVSGAPGLLWQDSGVIQYRVLNHDVEGVFGLALSHPLFYDVAYWVGKIPLGTLPWRVNMIAALAGAVTLANLFLFMRVWLGTTWPALVTVLSLGVAHTFWQHASMAETYTLWCALFTTELILLLRHTQTGRRCFLYGLAITNGLALSVHLLAVIPGICYLAYLAVLAGKRVLGRRDLACLPVCWLLGAAPYAWLVLRAGLSTGDWMATLSSALFGDRWREEVLNVTLSVKIVKENLLLLVLNFPTPNLLLCVAGGIALFRRERDRTLRWILAALALLFLMFAARYTVPDRYAFFIPFYISVAILMGLGAHAILKHGPFRHARPATLALALLPIGVYAGAPTWARAQQISLGTRADLPYRDDYRFFLQPWKTGDHGAERFALEVLEQVETGALIYADMTTVPALLFVRQDRGLRADVDVVGEVLATPGAPVVDAESIVHLVETRPVYVVSRNEGYCPRFILAGYGLKKKGLLWQVQKACCR